MSKKGCRCSSPPFRPPRPSNRPPSAPCACQAPRPPCTMPSACPPPCPCPPPLIDLCPPSCKTPRFLVPRVVCSGRIAKRCIEESLTVCGLPCGICPPLRLIGLETACQEPSVCLIEDCCGPSPIVAEVTIPLMAWVCDAIGQTYCGQTQVTVCCGMPGGCAREDGLLVATADVRLHDPGCCVCGTVFTVRLQVCVDVYMIRMSPCGPKTGCRMPFASPSLPMYPQPQPFM